MDTRGDSLSLLPTFQGPGAGVWQGQASHLLHRVGLSLRRHQRSEEQAGPLCGCGSAPRLVVCTPHPQDERARAGWS